MTGGPPGPGQGAEKVTQSDSGYSEPEPRYLAIGQVVRAHGVRGEISVKILTDFPDRFEITDWVYLGDEFEATAYRLEQFRWHKTNVLLTLAGIEDRTQAEQLRGQLVQVPIEEAVPLPEGSYYLFEVMGLEVFRLDGQRLGTITSVIETGANDVYVVETSTDQEILLPAIPDVIKSVDLEQGRMSVELIDGLI